jgi:small subunit ribosomal protein S3
MGQKVNPIGIRLGITRVWSSNWYANSRDYSKYLQADVKIRQYLMAKLKAAAISHIRIDRPARNAKVIIHSARPGLIIGKKGNDVETLKKNISSMLDLPAQVTIVEVKKPELNARLVAENIAQQLERRVMFRRAMKRAVQTTMRQGAKGIQIKVSGRLGGADIARTEWYREGRVPLHTFRADIDYAAVKAKTTYGIIGVKVWICRGEVLPTKSQKETEAK